MMTMITVSFQITYPVIHEDIQCTKLIMTEFHLMQETY